MTFWDVYHQYYDKIRKFILATVKNEWVADDLVQETFIRIQKHMDQVREAEKLPSWMFRIAYNLCQDHFRDRKHPSNPIPEMTEKMECQSSNGVFIQKKLEQQEMSACVQQQMLELPETLRTPLILHDIMEFKHQEIADILGISPENAKVRLHRARKQFKTILEKACRLEVDDRNVLVCEPVENSKP